MANPSRSWPLTVMGLLAAGALAVGILAGSAVLIGIGIAALALAVFWLWQAMREHHSIARLAKDAAKEQTDLRPDLVD